MLITTHSVDPQGLYREHLFKDITLKRDAMKDSLSLLSWRSQLWVCLYAFSIIRLHPALFMSHQPCPTLAALLVRFSDA